jgi:hypothetical protein
VTKQDGAVDLCLCEVFRLRLKLCLGIGTFGTRYLCTSSVRRIT